MTPKSIFEAKVDIWPFPSFWEVFRGLAWIWQVWPGSGESGQDLGFLGSGLDLEVWLRIWRSG